MIVRMAQIYAEVAEEMGLSRAVVESVGTDVLSSLREKLNGPTELGYELPKLGTFSFAQKRYLRFYEFLTKAVESGRYVIGESYPQDVWEKNQILIDKINIFKQDKARKTELKHARKETNQSSQGDSV